MMKDILQQFLDDAVDYVKLAEAMGAVGMRATTQEEFKEALCKSTDMWNIRF